MSPQTPYCSISVDLNCSCKRMKPDWDLLAEHAHPSVFIADVNCAVEESLCGDHHTGGQYPTILVYKRGTEELYTGGRGIEDLLKFVDKELAQRCYLASLDDTCSMKEKKYVEKWKEKGASAWKKEIARLTGMTTETLIYDLKKWLDDRRRILEQLLSGLNADEL
jgi:hypothetical protein